MATDSKPDAESGTKDDTEQERAEARASLSHGAEGATVIASVAVGLLFLAWLLIYLFLFLRRGYVG